MKSVLYQTYPEINAQVLSVFPQTDKGAEAMINAVDTHDAKIFEVDDNFCRDGDTITRTIHNLEDNGKYVSVGNLLGIAHDAARRIAVEDIEDTAALVAESVDVLLDTIGSHAFITSEDVIDEVGDEDEQ